MTQLVIVESPAKAKTIEKFLGGDFVVKSSIGHIRDMPKKGMGIDIENNFTPTYEISADKKKVVAELKKLVKTASKVYLATDEDREGEAIAWHLQEALGLAADTPRIVFNEITKNAILHAMQTPRTVNTHLVNAQQARRIIDRIVGFEISPVLWRKVSGAKSAGRVQSPVVRLVSEREREINAFTPVISYKTKAEFVIHGEYISAKTKHEFSSHDEALAFAQALTTSDFNIRSIKTTPTIRRPKPPFTTSTLQQEAASKIGLSVKQTMDIAQKLYRDGHITYMRTDSTFLSEEALTHIEVLLAGEYGNEYVNITRYKTKDTSAQEAHEGIRPTRFDSYPSLSGVDAKLYALIYKRTLASQMAPAQLEKTVLTIASNAEDFYTEGEVLVFPGFLKVYEYSTSENVLLPEVAEGDSLTLESLLIRESFSRAKPRYTESSLVKTIEELGIGRPSTFATMVATVQERGYVVKETREGKPREYQCIEIIDGKVVERIDTETTGTEKNKLFPTSVAYLLTDFLTNYFGEIVDYNWTKRLEDNFDNIAQDESLWQQVVADFYADFHTRIEESANISREEVNKTRVLGEVNGRPLSVRFGRYGAYAQIGDKEDEEKPVFAPLKANQDIETITFAQAQKLFELPRIVGSSEEYGDIKANYGRFGPYIQYGKKYVSLKEYIPEEVPLEHALELISAKEEFDKTRVIKTFEGSEIEILNGRFGPYIWNGKKKGKGQKNITIKKVFGEDKQPKELSLKECQDAISGKIGPKKPARKSAKKTSKKSKAS